MQSSTCKTVTKSPYNLPQPGGYQWGRRYRTYPPQGHTLQRNTTITTLTQTARARRSIGNATGEVSSYAQVKSIRQLYCLAVIMFCINPRCNLPFHIPLTSPIIGHGGTCELVHIFNRVGAVASVEAHERLMKSVIKAREKQGFHTELTMGAFRVVSIDNIDIMQKHA